jgi:Resolvase, N terminal domain
MKKPGGAVRRNATIRCAIYTRKSSEEGLEQEFNSLQAQREACEAFIDSQRHEGWVCQRAAYDDGGFSGATMDRPALQQLLADITRGDDRDRITRARQAAEALFAPKRPVTEQSVFDSSPAADSRKPRILATSPQAPAPRNGGRHHRGFAGDFPRNPHAAEFDGEQSAAARTSSDAVPLAGEPDARGDFR